MTKLTLDDLSEYTLSRVCQRSVKSLTLVFGEKTVEVPRLDPANFETIEGSVTGHFQSIPRHVIDSTVFFIDEVMMGPYERVKNYGSLT